MFCKECGTKNDDDAKHCKQCGSKLSNEQVPKKEKNSFIKEHKKLVLCIGGILIIFVIFALISIVNNQTDVDNDLSSGIEKILEDNNYSVSRSVKDGSVILNALYLNLKDDGNSEEDLVKVYIFPHKMAKGVASEDGLSPREINGIDGYGGYSQKVYTYTFEDNGNTIVIFAPSKDSPVLDIIVKDY